MKQFEALARTIDLWERNRGDSIALRQAWFKACSHIPKPLTETLFARFEERCALSRQAAAYWLRGIASLLLMEYDDSEFSSDEWNYIRRAMETESGSLPLDVLTYVLGKVLEHGSI